MQTYQYHPDINVRITFCELLIAVAKKDVSNAQKSSTSRHAAQLSLMRYQVRLYRLVEQQTQETLDSKP